MFERVSLLVGTFLATSSGVEMDARVQNRDVLEYLLGKDLPPITISSPSVKFLRDRYSGESICAIVSQKPVYLPPDLIEVFVYRSQPIRSTSSYLQGEESLQGEGGKHIRNCHSARLAKTANV